jgi:hypothetical protein
MLPSFVVGSFVVKNIHNWTHVAELPGIRLPQIGIFSQPGINHLPFKSPLISYFERGNFFLRNQPIDGEFVNLQIVGYLLGG